MSKNYILGAILLVVGLVLFCVAVSVPPPAPPVVGADGSSQTASAIQWSQIVAAILNLLGGGSIAGAIGAFWGKWGGAIQQVVHVVSPNVQGPSTVPVVDGIGKGVADSIELLQAAMAYAKNKSDKTQLRRLALAAITELNDVVGVESPAVATQLNALLIALTNDWVPATPVPVKAA